MNPGTLFVRTWIPQNNITSSTQTKKDLLWVYDAGDIQGFLIEKQSGKADCYVFKIESRTTTEDGKVQESGIILPESQFPLHVFSCEAYPLEITWSLPHMYFNIPAWKILTTVSSPQSPLPHQEPHHPKHQLSAQPSSHQPQKSNPLMRGKTQPMRQNMNTNSPRMKVQPSSNQAYHGQQKQQV